MVCSRGPQGAQRCSGPPAAGRGFGPGAELFADANAVAPAKNSWKRGAIIYYGLAHCISLLEINEKLFAEGEEPLL